MINGIINIYKEQGYTSHDVVAKLRGICKQKKIGHTGTLDPDAEGVLPVCLGNATKLCDMLTDKSKDYEAEFLFGRTTDTQDISGKVLSEKAVTVTEAQVTEAVMSFVGEYDQIPPMYSAIKINGKKLYELARQGKEIERKARQVCIHEIKILSMTLPCIKIQVSCSKGTYIRTLGYDIGEQLGCGAVMTKLTRVRAGNFYVKDALRLSQVEKMRDEGVLSQAVTSVESIFTHLSGAVVKKEFRRFIDNGNTLLPEQLLEEHLWSDTEQIKIYNDDGQFCGIYEYRTEGCLKPVRMFP